MVVTTADRNLRMFAAICSSILYMLNKYGDATNYDVLNRFANEQQKARLDCFLSFFFFCRSMFYLFMEISNPEDLNTIHFQTVLCNLPRTL